MGCDFFLTDYSPLYFEREGDGTIPRRRGGKFVRIEGPGAVHLVVSPEELSPTHACIVERFCREHGLPIRDDASMDRCSIDHEDWCVAGGGLWILDEDEGTLILQGESQAYGRYSRAGLSAQRRVGGYEVELR